MAKRGYSREFTPQTERRVRFEVDRIPPTLYEAVKAKAKRKGVSLRALTLQLWKDCATGPLAHVRTGDAGRSPQARRRYPGLGSSAGR